MNCKAYGASFCTELTLPLSFTATDKIKSFAVGQEGSPDILAARWFPVGRFDYNGA